jgi:hypothetical protein
MIQTDQALKSAADFRASFAHSHTLLSSRTHRADLEFGKHDAAARSSIEQVPFNHRNIVYAKLLANFQLPANVGTCDTEG